MPVEKDATGRACGYDCPARNTGDVKPASEVEMKVSFEM